MYRQLVCYCNKAQLQLVAYTDFFLFTKANIQYQYHKTITPGRLTEGITHQATVIMNVQRHHYPSRHTPKFGLVR